MKSPYTPLFRRGGVAFVVAHVLVCLAVLPLPLLVMARVSPRLVDEMYRGGGHFMYFIAGLHVLTVALYLALGSFHTGRSIFDQLGRKLHPKY
jgi:hypothetical protein